MVSQARSSAVCLARMGISASPQGSGTGLVAPAAAQRSNMTRMSSPCCAAGQNSDYVIVVDQDGEQEEIKVHRMLLESRSPFFRGMLESNMAEAQQGRYVVRDMLAPVVKAVLHFIYTGARGAGRRPALPW